MKHSRVATRKQNVININEKIENISKIDKINKELSTLEAVKPIEIRKSLK